MKRRTTVSQHRLIRRNVPNVPATAATGEHCPATGWWIAQGTAGAGQYLSEGSLLPALNGESRTWVFASLEGSPAGPGRQVSA